MPAGSGPQTSRATGVSVAAAEVAVAVVTGNWQSYLGTLISGYINFTPGTAQTATTFRLRQGNGTGGALVGIAHPETTVAAQQADWAICDGDGSAFAQAQQGGSYTLTAQTNAAGPGTVNVGIIELETQAPVA